MLVPFMNTQVAVKEYDCHFGHMPPHKLAPHVNIFVKVTKACNAHCLFCSNAGCQSVEGFDVDKLADAIHALRDAGIRVNRVNITGGEPAVVPSLVNRILERLEPYGDVHMHLNTNGLLPQSQELMRHPRWDSVSMSLHHYDLDRLSTLYGCRIPEDAFRFDGIDLQRMNCSCNLIRGYIDSAEEAHRMLDFALELGLPRIGFVALMKLNTFCQQHFVPLDDLHLEDIPHVYFTKSMNRGTDCRCSNYLYNNKARVLEIYMRHYANPTYCESSLVYDGQFLRQGFHDDNIIF